MPLTNPSRLCGSAPTNGFKLAAACRAGHSLRIPTDLSFSVKEHTHPGQWLQANSRQLAITNRWQLLSILSVNYQQHRAVGSSLTARVVGSQPPPFEQPTAICWRPCFQPRTLDAQKVAFFLSFQFKNILMPGWVNSFLGTMPDPPGAGFPETEYHEGVCKPPSFLKTALWGGFKGISWLKPAFFLTNAHGGKILHL